MAKKKPTLRIDQLEQGKEYILASIDPVSSWANNDVEGAIAYNNTAIEIFEEYASLNKPTKT